MTEANWHSVAAKDDVAPDEPIKVEVGDTEIALFNVDGDIFATSNICTNSGLCALAFTIHLTLLGAKGLRDVAMANHRAAVALADDLAQVAGVEVLTDQFFNEFTIRVPGDGADVIDRLADKGVLGGVPASRLWPDRPDLADRIIVAATEMTTRSDRAAYVAALKEVLA